MDAPTFSHDEGSVEALTEYAKAFTPAARQATSEAAAAALQDILRSSPEVPRQTGASQAAYTVTVDDDYDLKVRNPYVRVFVNEKDRTRRTWRDVEDAAAAAIGGLGSAGQQFKTETEDRALAADIAETIAEGTFLAARTAAKAYVAVKPVGAAKAAAKGIKTTGTVVRGLT